MDGYVFEKRSYVYDYGKRSLKLCCWYTCHEKYDKIAHFLMSDLPHRQLIIILRFIN